MLPVVLHNTLALNWASQKSKGKWDTICAMSRQLGAFQCLITEDSQQPWQTGFAERKNWSNLEDQMGHLAIRRYSVGGRTPIAGCVGWSLYVFFPVRGQFCPTSWMPWHGATSQEGGVPFPQSLKYNLLQIAKSWKKNKVRGLTDADFKAY